MPETQDTIDALEASIVHWEENLAAERVYEASVKMADCSLCRLFHSHFTRNPQSCKGCPVYEFTHTEYCSHTPYTEASSALRDWHRTSDETRSQDLITRARDEFRVHARAELNFLKGRLRELQGGGFPAATAQAEHTKD